MSISIRHCDLVSALVSLANNIRILISMFYRNLSPRSRAVIILKFNQFEIVEVIVINQLLLLTCTVRARNICIRITYSPSFSVPFHFLDCVAVRYIHRSLLHLSRAKRKNSLLSRANCTACQWPRLSQCNGTSSSRIVGGNQRRLRKMTHPCSIIAPVISIYFVLVYIYAGVNAWRRKK